MKPDALVYELTGNGLQFGAAQGVPSVNGDLRHTNAGRENLLGQGDRDTVQV